jgi:hypothetical protein
VLSMLKCHSGREYIKFSVRILSAHFMWRIGVYGFGMVTKVRVGCSGDRLVWKGRVGMSSGWEVG